jgi:arylsulfatase A-like enzyme
VTRLSVLGLLPLATLACGAVACGVPAQPVPRDHGPPGIVVICMDTLRADAVGLPGKGGSLPGLSPGRLPSVEAFARDAVVFGDATAPAPWTPPSVASLLTGLRPAGHGVGARLHDYGPHPLSPAVRTFAEILEERGWFTSAATSGGWLTPEQGVGRGFASFSSDFDLHDPAEVVAHWQATRPRGRPFFLFLHSYVAHDPYGDKDVVAQGRCGDVSEAERVADGIIEAVDNGKPAPDDLYSDMVRIRWTDKCGRTTLDHRLGTERLRIVLPRAYAWNQGGWRDDPARGDRLAARLKASYEEGLSFVDQRLARTFEALEAARLPKGTVVVFTADHGEAFGEDGHLYHGQSLNDAVLRVPLIVRAPGKLTGGKVVRGSVSLVDVLPTVLDLVGVPVPARLDGRSLLPMVRGEVKPVPSVAEAERTAVGDRPVIGMVCVRTRAAKWVFEYEVATGSWVREYLYDLREDPEERTPLSLDAGPGYGVTFCRAVMQAREEVLARYGQPAPPSPCAIVR